MTEDQTVRTHSNKKRCDLIAQYVSLCFGVEVTDGFISRGLQRQPVSWFVLLKTAIRLLKLKWGSIIHRAYILRKYIDFLSISHFIWL